MVIGLVIVAAGDYSVCLRAMVSGLNLYRVLVLITLSGMLPVWLWWKSLLSVGSLLPDSAMMIPFALWMVILCLM